MSAQGPGDTAQTSRVRLLNAGRMLFARKGYEQTSTATIAREAGSSESQLIRYFSGKAGLLEAIFDESWAALGEDIEERVAAASHGREAILNLLMLMIQAFARDHDIAFLFLFESRRMRGHSTELLLSKGFRRFTEILDSQIERGQQDGSFRTDIDRRVLCSAMLGTAEGMIRDRVMLERRQEVHPFDDATVLRTFTAMINGLASQKG